MRKQLLGLAVVASLALGCPATQIGPIRAEIEYDRDAASGKSGMTLTLGLDPCSVLTNIPIPSFFPSFISAGITLGVGLLCD